jgi:hypothetical protein
VAVGVLDEVGVAVIVFVYVTVCVTVDVKVLVGVAVSVSVSVIVGVNVMVAVRVGVAVRVPVAVGVGVGVPATVITIIMASPVSPPLSCAMLSITIGVTVQVGEATEQGSEPVAGSNTAGALCSISSCPLRNRAKWLSL